MQLQETNDLNIVGTTRVVVGRGGQVQCVLTGKEVRAIEALEVGRRKSYGQAIMILKLRPGAKING